MNYYRYCNVCGLTRNFIDWQRPNDPELIVCARCGSPMHDWRHEITDLDGGPHYVDLRRDCTDGHPWNLVGHGRNFRSLDQAREWLTKHWNDVPGIEDRSYAIAEAAVSNS